MGGVSLPFSGHFVQAQDNCISLRGGVQGSEKTWGIVGKGHMRQGISVTSPVSMVLGALWIFPLPGNQGSLCVLQISSQGSGKLIPPTPTPKKQIFMLPSQLERGP